ncbi:MAG TPA: hypothetical protein VLH79_12375 [Chthonomonadales bacterium]|nr:hypothetical protein [Chthonomonadales bacterium]
MKHAVPLLLLLLAAAGCPAPSADHAPPAAPPAPPADRPDRHATRADVRVLGLCQRATRADVRRLAGDREWRRAGAVQNGRLADARVRLPGGYARVTAEGVSYVAAERRSAVCRPFVVGMPCSAFREAFDPPIDPPGKRARVYDGQLAGQPAGVGRSDLPGMSAALYAVALGKPETLLRVTVRRGAVSKIELLSGLSGPSSEAHRAFALAELRRGHAEWEKEWAEYEAAQRARPDYGLVLRRSSAYLSAPHGPSVREATVMGVVKSFRDEAVNVRVRVEWTSRAGQHAGAGETTLESVQPGEERDFVVRADEVLRPHTYRVTLSAARQGQR